MHKALDSKPNMAQLEAAIPNFRKMWKAIKEECGTNQRAPKYVSFTDESHPVYGDDHDVAKRFVVELTSGKVLGTRHVSCGENAINNGNAANAVEAIPTNHAIVTCVYNDYYRSFAMEFQVAPGTLVKELAA